MESEGASGNTDDATVSAAVEDDVPGDDYAEVISDTEADTAEVSANAEDQKQLDTTDEELIGDKEDADGEDVASVSLDENGDPIDSETVGEAVLTSGTVTLSQAKLRDISPSSP